MNCDYGIKLHPTDIEDTLRFPIRENDVTNYIVPAGKTGRLYITVKGQSVSNIQFKIWASNTLDTADGIAVYESLN